MKVRTDHKVTVECKGEVTLTSDGTEPVIEANAEIAAEFLLTSLRVLAVSGRNLSYRQNPAYKNTYDALLSVVAQTWPGANEYIVVEEALRDAAVTIKSIAQRMIDDRQYHMALLYSRTRQIPHPRSN